MPPALGVSLSPRSPSTSRMRPTHPEEADLLLSKATDLNVNLIQRMAQKRLEYLTKHLGTAAQPGRHAELTGTDPRRSGTQLTRCPEPALGTGRGNRPLPPRGRAALGPLPTGHTSRTQPPGRQSHSRHRWSPRSDPLPSLALACFPQGLGPGSWLATSSEALACRMEPAAGDPAGTLWPGGVLHTEITFSGRQEMQPNTKKHR